MTSPFNVWSLLYYLTEVEGLTWRQGDYNALKIIRAVKGEPIKGYFEVNVGKQRKKFSQENIDEFFPSLFATLAAKLKEMVAEPIDIVPIPNSTASVGSKDQFNTLLHAQAIASRMGNGSQAVAAVRWKHAKTPSHRGGGRDPDVHYENLQVVTKPKRKCVLYDDVTTTGSQMIAVYRRLAECGATPELGVVVGRAVKVQKVPWLGWQNEALETVSTPFDWDL